MRVLYDGRVEEYRAVWMEGKKIKCIDQRVLPENFVIREIKNTDEACKAIKSMMVRGAPTIGATAAYAMAQAYLLGEDLAKTANALKKTRPTAHDLFHAIDLVLNSSDPVEEAEKYVESIVERCRLIGKHGESLLNDHAHILTHCNAGALASVDIGTALAPIRMAHYSGKSLHVYVDETRPRLQGARLTAWELKNEGIEHTIIADNAAGYYMWKGKIDIVIVGADRVACNGDVANKVGTLEKAVIAKEFGVKFYVAFPSSTVDPKAKFGAEIPIEERDEKEVLEIAGTRIAPEGSRAKNPAFDITPAKYIDGYITEYGIIDACGIKKFITHLVAKTK
ncbi:MAG: S-methyl-5-thioribose-1-phosphate isomerase [Thermoplasmata archaeon]|nr:MAG: S-methyl-5-thioribose-1-phosphate isomerase [Thermoplasmata archaeon]